MLLQGCLFVVIVRGILKSGSMSCTLCMLIDGCKWALKHGHVGSHGRKQETRIKCDSLVTLNVELPDTGALEEAVNREGVYGRRGEGGSEVMKWSWRGRKKILKWSKVKLGSKKDFEVKWSGGPKKKRFRSKVNFTSAPPPPLDSTQLQLCMKTRRTQNSTASLFLDQTSVSQVRSTLKCQSTELREHLYATTWNTRVPSRRRVLQRPTRSIKLLDYMRDFSFCISVLMFVNASLVGIQLPDKKLITSKGCLKSSTLPLTSRLDDENAWSNPFCRRN